jgi:hypothetical protein
MMMNNVVQLDTSKKAGFLWAPPCRHKKLSKAWRVHTEQGQVLDITQRLLVQKEQIGEDKLIKQMAEEYIYGNTMPFGALYYIYFPNGPSSPTMGLLDHQMSIFEKINEYITKKGLSKF